MIPFSYYQKALPGDVIFPFYHLVEDEVPVHTKHLYQVIGIKQFEKDVEWFLKHFEPVSFQEFLDKRHTNKPKVVFSFDDGLREVHDFVAPIFKQKGIPAIVFVNSAFVDNRDLFYRFKASILAEHFTKEKETKKANYALSLTYQESDTLNKMALEVDIHWTDYLKEKKPYLTLAQLHNLKDHCSFDIGAHSVDHPEYFKLSLPQQIKQSIDSVSFVKKQFPDQNNQLFAFPFTDWGVGDNFFSILHSELICGYTFGTAGLKDEYQKHHFQRIPMELGFKTAEQVLKKEITAYNLKGLVGRRGVRR